MGAGGAGRPEARRRASGLEANFQAAVTGTTDFSNNELVLDVTQRAWSDFQAAAETLAAQVTATDAALRPAYSGTDAAGLISTLGRRAYRRPLTAAETSTYMTLYNTGASLMGTRSAFLKGASLVIRALLQSPHFLFRTEMGANGAALSGYEVAAKLSLWLRGTTPSDALLDSARRRSPPPTPRRRWRRRCWARTTATAVMRQFHGELLHFERYELISKVNTPTYKPALNTELQDVSYLFFDRIFKQGLGVKQILTSTTGYVGANTAPLYGMSAPASGYVERDLGAQRVGYFSQLPFLTLYAHNDEPSSILRGVSMNLDVLCAQLGPPAAVIPPIPPLMAGQTNRQRIDTLTAGCGQSCHNEMINPLGFAFEHFDGMGQWRDTENGGLTIDSSGSYSFADGTSKTWTGAADLMQALARFAAGPHLLREEAGQLRAPARRRRERHADAHRADVVQHGVHRFGQAAGHRPRQEQRVPHPRRRHPVKRTPEETIRPILNERTGALEGFRTSPEAARRNRINRRAFLRGAGTVAIGLPFLEGLQERSAWAQSAPPVFSFTIVGSCGVVGSKFFPTATGPLTTANLSAATDKATSVLAPHAANLLFIKNINFPQGGPKSCGHAEGLCQSMTAIVPGSSGTVRVRRRSVRRRGDRQGGQRERRRSHDAVRGWEELHRRTDLVQGRPARARCGRPT